MCVVWVLGGGGCQYQCCNAMSCEMQVFDFVGYVLFILMLLHITKIIQNLKVSHNNAQF